jgi:dihydrolipoamide dehydrogenase
VTSGRGRENFDVILLGAGPGGETCAGRLLKGGKSVALVERELLGGECAYWACIPSKTLLRPPEARNGARRAAGTSTPELSWDDTRAYRNYMIRDLDDSGQVDNWKAAGAEVIKGTGRITGPGRVDVDGRTLHAEHIVVATGSAPKIPPIEGLDDVPVWTNREATTLNEIPARTVIVGGGPVGVELGQFLARFGSQVTLVQSADRLIGREDPRVGELAAQALAQDGIDVRTGRQARRVHREGDSTVVELDDSSTLTTDAVVIATGRVPRTQDLGLETLGIRPDSKGLSTDDRCRAGDGLWALGDVTGVMLFTHVAQYQGRVVADNILGTHRTATYRGVPRVVFSDPEIAAVGLTSQEAKDQGLDVATATISLPKAIARPHTYERDPRGELGVIADRQRNVLVGAWAVAPLASEWIHQAALAIRAEIPLDVLLDGVAQFPTYSEAYLAAFQRL